MKLIIVFGLINVLNVVVTYLSKILKLNLTKLLGIKRLAQVAHKIIILIIKI
jgi:hypothetical protein